jgi:hypothetical protein
MNKSLYRLCRWLDKEVSVNRFVEGVELKFVARALEKSLMKRYGFTDWQVRCVLDYYLLSFHEYAQTVLGHLKVSQMLSSSYAFAIKKYVRELDKEGESTKREDECVYGKGSGCKFEEDGKCTKIHPCVHAETEDRFDCCSYEAKELKA